MPANLVVNIAGEDPNPGHGSISLRDAIAMANGNNQANTITFAPGITTVQITDPAPLDLSEMGQANLTTINGGGVVVLQRDGTATADGVLSIGGGAFVELSGLTITGGDAAVAGAGLLSSGADVTLMDVTVTGNTALPDSNTTGFGSDAGNGAGIANFGTMRLIDCTVSDNTAAGFGGGIWNSGVLSLTDSTIAGNSAGSTGGGIFDGVVLFPGAERSAVAAVQGIVAANSTISGNQAKDSGGGIYVSGATETLTNVTISNNRSNAGNNSATQPGGGMFVYKANVTLNNSIVSGNFNGSTGTTADDVSGTLQSSSSHNLIGGNALLGPLANNGGPTMTQALLSGSPAIDGGSNALAVDQNGNSLTTDQRGFSRISDGTVDIGAFESQVPLPSNPAQVIVAGSGPGGQPRVNVYNATGGPVASFLAFSPNFTGGVHVAVADMNGDEVPDIIVGAGAGGGPEVIVFDGTKLGELQANGELAPDAVITSFYAYAPGFTGGVNVAGADGRIVTGAGPGGGPNVKVFTSGTVILGGDASTVFAQHASFYAYAPNFSGGVSVAVGDLNGDGTADVVTGAGPGGGPHVEVFDGASLFAFGSPATNTVANPIKSFYAYSPSFSGGVTVAVGDINGDGKPDIVTGAGPGMDPLVNVFDYATLNVLASVDAYSKGFTGGVNVATAEYNGNTNDDIVTGAGPGGGPAVGVFQINPVLGETPFNPLPDLAAAFYAFDPTFMGGVFVG